MKKLFLLFAITLFAGVAFAQTANVSGTEESLNKNLEENFIEFEMPEEVTSDVVEKSAQYYTDYFTVDFDENTQIARINITDQKDQAKRVISRFLLSSGVRTINFQNKDYTIMEFYSNFLE